MEAGSLNKAQIEVLNALASLHTEEDIKALKTAICEFFAKRADVALNKLWDEGLLDENKIQSFANSHPRTPYQQ